jgi:hypothetical protein
MDTSFIQGIFSCKTSTCLNFDIPIDVLYDVDGVVICGVCNETLYDQRPVKDANTLPSESSIPSTPQAGA